MFSEQSLSSSSVELCFRFCLRRLRFLRSLPSLASLLSASRLSLKKLSGRFLISVARLTLPTPGDLREGSETRLQRCRSALSFSTRDIGGGLLLSESSSPALRLSFLFLLRLCFSSVFSFTLGRAPRLSDSERFSIASDIPWQDMTADCHSWPSCSPSCLGVLLSSQLIQTASWQRAKHSRSSIQWPQLIIGDIIGDII